MSEKPTPMMFDFLTMDENFDEICDRLFGFSPNRQDTRADDEARQLAEDVQNLDNLIDRANPGAKEKMATIRRNAAIDLILTNHDEALRTNLALASAIGASSSENQDEAIRQLKRKAIRELIGQILDLKVACGSFEEDMNRTRQLLADSIKLTSLNIRNSQELSEKLFEAKKELASLNVLSAKLVTFQGELRSRGLTNTMTVEDLLLALDRVSWPFHDDSNGKFLQPNDDCQHACCVHGGRIIPEPSSETPAETTEPADTTEEVVSEAVATESAEVAVPSPAPKPPRARKSIIVKVTEKITTRKAREKKAPAKKTAKKGSKPTATEKPKEKRRRIEGGWPPEDVW